MSAGVDSLTAGKVAPTVARHRMIDTAVGALKPLTDDPCSRLLNH